MGENSSVTGPKSTFEAYKAEGDMLVKQQEFPKALERYDQALELRPEDRNCLVARSRCYLCMGDTENALKDAESSMQEEPAFFKGLLCKADALYFKGDFEMALVYYHRGNRLRPEQHEFRLGIQKCKEAIENSVGSPDKVKLHKEGDLSYFYKPLEEEAAMKKKQQQQIKTGRRAAQDQKKKARPISGNKDKTIKQLLGSLYADREFLEKLLKEEDVRLEGLQTCSRCKYKTNLCTCSQLRDIEQSGKFGDGNETFKVYSEKFKNKKVVLEPEVTKKQKNGSDSEDDDANAAPKRVPKKPDAKKLKTKTSSAIHELALNGLIYLDTRTDFWRQQKPMYARKRDKDLQQAKISKKTSDPAKYTLRKLREIDEAYTGRQYKKVLKESERMIKMLDTWTEEELANKQEVKASLHSSTGNAHLELGEYEEALRDHRCDLDIARDLQNEELESRAMDNLGRVYARMGKFEEAIDVWEQKVEKKSDLQDLEAAWIYHELGRCYLETNNIDKALEYGEKSYSFAQTAEDEVWQLHSSVLIAQSQVKKEDYQSAVDSFERALEFAKLQEDSDAEKAIKKALKEVNDKIAQKASLSEDKPEQKVEDKKEEEYEQDFQDYGDGEDDEEEEDIQEFDDRGSKVKNRRYKWKTVSVANTFKPQKKATVNAVSELTANEEDSNPTQESGDINPAESFLNGHEEDGVDEIQEEIAFRSNSQLSVSGSPSVGDCKTVTPRSNSRSSPIIPSIGGSPEYSTPQMAEAAPDRESLSPPSTGYCRQQTPSVETLSTKSPSRSTQREIKGSERENPIHSSLEADASAGGTLKDQTPELKPDNISKASSRKSSRLSRPSIGSRSDIRTPLIPSRASHASTALSAQQYVQEEATTDQPSDGYRSASIGSVGEGQTPSMHSSGREALSPSPRSSLASSIIDYLKEENDQEEEDLDAGSISAESLPENQRSPSARSGVVSSLNNSERDVNSPSIESRRDETDTSTGPVMRPEAADATRNTDDIIAKKNKQETSPSKNTDSYDKEKEDNSEEAKIPSPQPSPPTSPVHEEGEENSKDRYEENI